MDNAIDPAWMVVQVKAKKCDIPLGSYIAEFLRYEQCEITVANKPEKRLRWHFKISTGNMAGTEINDITDLGISDRNKAGRIVQGFRGGELKNGDKVQPYIDAAIGKHWLVNWNKGSQGGVGIQGVTSMPDMPK